MEEYQYYYVRLKDGLYVEDVRERLGAFFDYVVNGLGSSGADAVDLLVNSGLARELEIQNPRFTSGMSGLELLTWALAECGRDEALTVTSGLQGSVLSKDYWLGYMLGYFQCTMGWEYRRIFEAVSYAELREMYYSTQCLSENEYVQEVLKKLRAAHGLTRLAQYRKAAGWTQGELARRAGISYRAIQQYEQGKKDINKAAADTVRKLALTFGCRIEDLLEPPNWC